MLFNSKDLICVSNLRKWKWFSCGWFNMYLTQDNENDSVVDVGLHM